LPSTKDRIERHGLEGFDEPLHFGIHGGIKHFYQEKYGREITGPEYPATLDHMIAGVGG
jgi:predicted hydrocarbon binding protein